MLQREHSATLLAFIKLPFVIKTFDLYIFEWPLKTGFTVVLHVDKSKEQFFSQLCSYNLDTYCVFRYTVKSV